MNLFALIFLSLCSFFVINWFGKHMAYSGYMTLSIFYKTDEAPIFNNLFRIISPSILLIVYSLILKLLGFENLIHDLWLIVPTMFLIRATYNLINERGRLLNWLSYILQVILASSLSYWVYKEMISKGEFYFPDIKSFGSEFWLLIILFMYQTLNEVHYSDEGSNRRKDLYVKTRYLSNSKKYSSVILALSKNVEIEKLSHSILILESFNRPFVLRWLENVYCRLFKLEVSQGVMQVRSKIPISDTPRFLES